MLTSTLQICGVLNDPEATASSIVNVLPLSMGANASLVRRGQGYTVPGCTLTLTSSSLTTTTASLTQSTLLRLARRSPGHYIDQNAVNFAVVRPVETSLGTKDSANNIVYDESNAATPWKPWGSQSGFGQVYTKGPNLPKYVAVAVGIVCGVLVVVLGFWIVSRIMLNKKAKRRALAQRGETEEVSRT